LSLKALISNGLKIAFSLGLGILLIWLIYKDLTAEDKENIINSFKKANYWWFALSFFLGLLSHISRAKRWNLLLNNMGYSPQLSTSFFSVMIGYLANMALPRFGEIARCGVMGKKENIPFEKLFGTVIAERVIDLLILMSIASFTLITQYSYLQTYIMEKLIQPMGENSGDDSSNKFYILASIALLVLVVYFLLSNKIPALIEKIKVFLRGLLEGFRSVLQIKQRIEFIFHTLFIWMMYFFLYFVCFFCLPETSNVPIGGVFASFIAGSIGIIAVQGGIGAYHMLVTQTLILYGVSKEFGFAFSWIAWASQTIMILIFGFISLIALNFIKK
jgi:uncharacterized membrane protein YbhN (UPF0104 family)